MKNVRMGIKETGTKFTTGIVFSPSWDDGHAVVSKLHGLGLLKDLVPEINVTVILAHRGPFKSTVRLMLERADTRNYEKKAPFEVLALLWVVACFNYKWCGGPYPGTITPVRRKRWKAVLEFRCPYCAQLFVPNKRFKSRSVILNQYSSWIKKHGYECEELLHLDRSVVL